MKKIMFFAVLAALVCCAGTAFAKSGDVSGKIYATDIKAYINGIEVPSYNIGGKTAFVIEDVFGKGCYTYRDECRALTWSFLSPESVVSGTSKSGAKPGTPVGKIYETDIKTYMYDKLLPAFSLNGKMAVAIEDIAGDEVFSDIGARYYWNPENREIFLEFMYSNSSEISKLCNAKHLTGKVENGKAEFSPELFNYGSLSFDIPDGIDEIYCGGELVGYSLKRCMNTFYCGDDGKWTLKTDSPYTVVYWDTAAVQKILADVTPVMPTREEQILYYTEEMSMFYTVKERLDTDDYTFMYLSFGGVMHGGTECILRIAADGTVVDYADNFESVSYGGGKFFDNAKLDRDARKFFFRYDRDYVLDLDSGELKNN